MPKTFATTVLTLGCLGALGLGCGSTPATDAGPLPTDAPVVVDAPVPATDAPVGDTWSSYAMGFFQTYCVECHSGPPSGRDFRSIDDVIRDGSIIRCGVTPASEPLSGCSGGPSAGMFPVGDGPFPSDDERRRIVAWIDAGQPE